MMRARIPIFLGALVAAFCLSPSAFAEFEVREVDPLSEKDLSSFNVEGEGGWKMDDKSDLVYTFVVCPRAKAETSLVYRMRKFKDGFQVTWHMMGGLKYRRLKFLVVPESGERIEVPLDARLLGRKDWHRVRVTVEDGKAHAKIDDEKLDPVAVPTDQMLTFALTVPKRGEAKIRSIKLKYLVVNREQAKPEEGFVRIFDGKTLDGWTQLPEGKEFFHLKAQRIEGELPRNGEVREAHLVYRDAVFQDFTLKMRVGAGARGLLLLGRLGIRNGPRPVYTDITGYFPGDKDWSDVTWEVKGPLVSLSVNGRKVWSQTAAKEQGHPLPVRIILIRGGKCSLRDIRVSAPANLQPGASWARYTKESGVTMATGGGGGQAAGGASRVTGGRSFEMFNGKDLTDWRGIPADAWSVADGKIVGLTYGKSRGADLLYAKYWFTEYRVSFKLQKGSLKAEFVAKAFPRDPKKAPVRIKIEDAWFGGDKWTEFEATLMEGTLNFKANGKTVKSLTVPKESGAIGFHVDKEGGVGIKDIWFNKKPE